MLSKKRQAICDEARTWIDTPFQHQAMVKGTAVDCAMLCVGVALNVGLIKKRDLINVPNYPRQWNINQDYPMLTVIMESFGCQEKAVNKMYPGDILVFEYAKVPAHLGILLEDGNIIHAYSASVNKVVINSLAAQYLDKLIQVYKFPGV